MSYQFTHIFEELPIYKGLAVFATGEAEISYTVHSAEPDIGIMRAYAEPEIDSITIYGAHDGDRGRKLEPSELLYKQIEEALIADEGRLEEACEEHFRE